jgi:NTP pyrophosphatase (non-canonical NTP hydrolase)
MKMDEYQERAGRTNIYPDTSDGLHALVMGLCSESGEVADKIKKAIRDEHGSISSDREWAIVSEIGDVLWYVSQLASVLGVGLDFVARNNLNKLADRAGRGKIGGSGDER